MYEQHFTLRQAPFSIAPDPEFLYLSPGHREAFAHLSYGLTQGGFVLITGEVGTGKTTLLRNLLREMPPDTDVAFILNPRLTVRELLETICDELGITYDHADRASTKHYVDALSAHLLEAHAAGRSTLLIIDEAQNLAPVVLEQIRLLTNLETDKRKLLRIMLLGQPELLDLLARKELRQLAQRITARYHLRGLDRQETEAYVIHRLQRAGGSALIFTRPALRRLYRISRGIPRLINLIADRALLGAYAAGQHRVGWRLIGTASREVLGLPGRRWQQRIAVTAALVLLGITIVTGWFAFTSSDNPVVVTGTRAAAPDATPAIADTGSTPESAPIDDGSNEIAQDGTPTAAPSDSRAERGSTASTAASLAQRPVTPAVAPLPTPAPNASLDEFTRPDLTSAETQARAYAAAYDRWNADVGSVTADMIPCDLAPRVNLQCLGTTGTWQDVADYDLPAVIELWDTGTTPFYGTVIELEGELVTLALGDQTLTLQTSTLANHWYGSFVILWRTPPDYAGSIRPGDRHPTVAWVRDTLADRERRVAGSLDRSFFDPTLHEAVIAFQRDAGLPPDGVVGPSTWIALIRRADASLPRLVSVKERAADVPRS
ncbi:MAG: ral secretion pathway protein [Pseudomonadota bacterium]|jgi:general secretion pathway protein A